VPRCCHRSPRQPTLGAGLGVTDAGTDDIYAAMDWLADQQDDIEAKLARRHLAPKPNPARMALFDLSSSWLEGTRCPLAARGYSRDGKKGGLQIGHQHRPGLGPLLRRGNLRQLRLGARLIARSRSERTGSSGSPRTGTRLALPRYTEVGPWDAISDCYALNVDDTCAWACYGPDFPVVCIREDTVTGRHNDIKGARALAVTGSRAALFGSYGPGL
jgi:hypothetical protein